MDVEEQCIYRVALQDPESLGAAGRLMDCVDAGVLGEQEAEFGERREFIVHDDHVDHAP